MSKGKIRRAVVTRETEWSLASGFRIKGARCEVLSQVKSGVQMFVRFDQALVPRGGGSTRWYAWVDADALAQEAE